MINQEKTEIPMATLLLTEMADMVKEMVAVMEMEKVQAVGLEMDQVLVAEKLVLI